MTRPATAAEPSVSAKRVPHEAALRVAEQPGALVERQPGRRSPPLIGVRTQ
jgi:hypothetical protein